MPIPRTALAIACFAATAVTQEPPPAPPATFAGRDATAWAQRVWTNSSTVVAELAAGRRASFAVLAELLTHLDANAAAAAARACGVIGPDAAPLVPALTAGLRDPASSWVQANCATALAAIGTVDASILATMLEHVCRSDGWHLRHECACALARLVDDAPARLLAAAAADEFVD